MNPDLRERLRNSALARDSFWAIVGNGLGNGLLLLAGLLIARMLGADLYGEYGVVKSTMVYSATFATFGLGITATKFLSDYVRQNRTRALAVIRDSLRITLAFSSLIALALFVGARWIAVWQHAEGLALALRMLSVIIIIRAMTTTEQGILAGLGDFKVIGINNILSGLSMLLLAVGFTYLWSLMGALMALLISQLVGMVLNTLAVRRYCRQLLSEVQPDSNSSVKELLSFSLPIAMQECLYSACNWLGIMVLNLYATEGDVGIFTASIQWNIIIMMIPTLLANVVLAHLSGTIHDEAAHQNTMRKLLLVNEACAIIPFVLIYPLAGFIASLYGPGFENMTVVLHILLFDALLYSVTTVFKSEFLASGHNWWLFTLRAIKDMLLVVVAYLLLTNVPDGWSGAECYATAYISSSVCYLLLTVGIYMCLIYKKTK